MEVFRQMNILRSSEERLKKTPKIDLGMAKALKLYLTTLWKHATPAFEKFVEIMEGEYSRPSSANTLEEARVASASVARGGDPVSAAHHPGAKVAHLNGSPFTPQSSLEMLVNVLNRRKMASSPSVREERYAELKRFMGYWQRSYQKDPAEKTDVNTRGSGGTPPNTHMNVGAEVSTSVQGHLDLIQRLKNMTMDACAEYVKMRRERSAGAIDNGQGNVVVSGNLKTSHNATT